LAGQCDTTSVGVSDKKTKTFTAHVENWIFVPFQPFALYELEVTPIPLHHGNCICNGFLFRSAHSSKQTVYFSDFRCRSSKIPESDKPGCPEILLQDFSNLTFCVFPEKTLAALLELPVQHLFLDALSFNRTYTHSNYSETVTLIKTLKSKGVILEYIWLTGLGCGLEYYETNASLEPEFEETGLHVQCAYDGLVLSVD